MEFRSNSTLRELLLRLALLAASTLFALFLLELGLRLLGFSPRAPRSANDGVFTFFRHDPELGWDLVPGARDRHTTPEFDVSIEITDQGFREGRLYPVEPQPGRTVVVGDSFTFGHGVEESEGWAARIERPDREVINLAVTGYGLDQQILKLEKHLPGLSPQRVLVGLFIGDIFRTARTSYLGYAKPWFEVEGSILRLRGQPVPTLPPAPGLFERSALGNAAGVPTRDLFEHLGYGRAWPRTHALLLRLAHTCSEAGIAASVVLIPKDRSVEGASSSRRRLHDQALFEARQVVRDAGLPLIDTTPALRAAATRPGSLYYPGDGHWTPAAHEIAARVVDEALSLDLSVEHDS